MDSVSNVGERVGLVLENGSSCVLAKRWGSLLGLQQMVGSF